MPPMNFNRTLPRRTLAFGVLAVLLAACAPTSTPAPTAAPTARPAATTAPTATTAPAATAASAATTPPAATAPAATVPAPTAAPAAATKMNLNTASDADLLKNIPGFGNNMLREFKEYRPYTSITQFRRELGKYVDAKQVAEYEKYVFVPIDINKADAATLQQFPGVDATEAAALIAARPFANADAFLTKVTPMVSAAELAAGRAYLAP